jgi:lysophospholipase L1-like esterase
VAQWAGKSAIVPETDHLVTFCGSDTVTIPAGEEVLSDPIPFPLTAGADLAVSLYIPKTSNVPATMHTFGNQTAYFSLGDATGHTTLPSAVTDTVRPYLTGIEVDAPAAAVITLGDSLTDGMLSSLDRNLRWPDDLARRLANKLGVVNAGIAGNCVLMDCVGPNAIARFQRDVLQVAGAKYLIVLAGVTDIGNAPGLSAAQLTDAYRRMAALAHAANILVFGATIPPFGGSQYATAAHESLRQQVNTFIRTSGAFDAVIDFDKALADPANPSIILAEFDGDHIRPNDAGYQTMANAVDLALFGKP